MSRNNAYEKLRAAKPGGGGTKPAAQPQPQTAPEPKQTGLERVWGWLGIGNQNQQSAPAPSGRTFGGSFAEDVHAYSDESEAVKQAEEERKRREEEERRRKEEEERRKAEEERRKQAEERRRQEAERARDAYLDEQQALLEASKAREKEEEKDPSAAPQDDRRGDAAPQEDKPQDDKETPQSGGEFKTNDERDALLRELAELSQNEGYITNEADANAAAAREREIIARVQEIDKELGNPERYYDEAGRLGGIARGWANEQAAGYSNALGTIAALAGDQDEAGRAIADSSIAGYVTDPVAEALARQDAEQGNLDSLGVLDTNQQITDATQAFADEARAKSAEEMAKAKAGLSGFESLMVDVTKGALDLGSDAIVNLLVPGGGLTAMGTRVFGLAAADQRDKGGSVGQQLLAGLKSAGIEIFTEKIGGPFEKVYGKTFTGKIVNEAMDKLGSSPVGKRLLSLAEGYVSEGMEEIMSNVLNVAADRIFQLDPNAKIDWSEALYEGMIGGLLGMAGGGFRGLNAEQRNAAIEKIVDAALNMQTETEAGADPSAALRSAQDDSAGAPSFAGENVLTDDSGTGGNAQTALAAAAGPQTPGQSLAGTEQMVPDSGTGTSDPVQALLNAAGVQTQTQTPGAPSLAGENTPVTDSGTGGNNEMTAQDYLAMRALQGWNTQQPGLAGENMAVPDAGTVGQDSSPAAQNDSESEQAEERAEEIVEALLGEDAAATEEGQAAVDEIVEILAGVNTPVTDSGTGTAPESANDRLNRREAESWQRTIDALANSKENTTEAVENEKGGITQAPNAQGPGNTSETSLASLPQENVSDTGTVLNMAETAPQVTSEAPQRANTAHEVEGSPSDATLSQPEINVNGEEANTQSTADQVQEWLQGLGEIEEAAESPAAQETAEPKGQSVADLLVDVLNKGANRTQTAMDTVDRLFFRPARESFFGAELLDRMETAAQSLSGSGAIGESMKALASGSKSVDSFIQDYMALNRGESGDQYFFDPKVAEALSDLQEDMVGGGHLDESGNMTPAFRERMERAVAMVEHRTKRQADLLNVRADVDEEIERSKPPVRRGVKGALSSAANAYTRIQMRPDTWFFSLGGFDRVNSKALYELGNKARTVTADKINIHQTAENSFSGAARMKGYRAFAQGKTTMPNIVPGLSGDAISLNYAVGLLKTLETDGAIDHIILHGTSFAFNEKELYSGRNNSGFGDREGYAQDVPLLSSNSLVALENAATEKESLAARQTAEMELNRLADTLREYIAQDPIASVVYSSSFDAMAYLRDELNKTSQEMYGADVATQDRFYWPLEVDNWDGSHELLNDPTSGLKGSSIVQRRTGPSGALRIRPFTDVMSRYIDQASDWAAFAEFSDELELLAKDAGDEASLVSQIDKTHGRAYGKWLETYVNDLNGQGAKTNPVLGRLRSNLAQSSLLLNGSVALKQTPSYFDFGGEIDLDILFKNWRPFRPARAYDRNSLVQEIDQRSGMLGSRRMGYNTVEIGEATSAARSLGTSFANKLPGWLTNWINKSDFRTVSNGLLACAEQVQRDNPGVRVGSDAYYDLVAEKFETAVMHSQPIYNRQYRAEYLRSSNEWVRMFSMFRTQQTQNLNQLTTAIGEYQAAKRNGDTAEIDRSGKKLQGVVGGQIAATVLFSVLTAVGKTLLHKNYDIKDEDGNVDPEKVAKRLGLNFVGTVAGTLWFGDTVSAIAIDTITNAATGGEGTSEFYSFEDSASGMIADIAEGVVNFAKNPSLKNGRNLVFALSQSQGISARNVYNMLNTLVMYSLDALGQNPGSYDDVITMIEHGKMSVKQRSTETAKAAMNFFRKGKQEQADALLSTLDPEDKDSVAGVKKAATDALKAGTIDEATYMAVLQTYCGLSEGDAKKQVYKAAGLRQEYDPIMDAGYSEDEAAAIFKEIDTSGNGSLTQKEIWAYYEANPDLDAVIGALWNAMGYTGPHTKTWAEYKGYKGA